MFNLWRNLPLSHRHRALLRLACVVLILAGQQAHAQNAVLNPTDFDAYLKPYVATNNVSGSVLIRRGETVLFAKSYGFADHDKKIPNRLDTRFHVASLSILFTSTAILRLIDQGKLSFDTHVAEVVSGVPNGDRITIRELLEQTSGLPDANDQPTYEELYKAHQTPESLVAYVRQLPPFSEPGVKSDREEHSGQNLLALILERKTGMPFAQAMKAEVFEPFALHDSGIDDDSPLRGQMARGNRVKGSFDLKPAPSIHWTSKAGNGSAYSTAGDELKWLQEIVHGNLLTESSRKTMFTIGAGYGWESVQSVRFGQPVYYVGGRAPGFSSFMAYLPAADLMVVSLTNIENEANPKIVLDLAALLLGKPYQAFQYQPVPRALVGQPSGDFVFGPDFYRPSGKLNLVSDANGVTLNWPGGPASGLLPIGKDQFIDRYYWTNATLVRDKNGNPIELEFGKFRGTLSTPPGIN